MTVSNPPFRMLVWWDVDVHIGKYTKRKLTARPLRRLERVLGHRLHVEERTRYGIMPEGCWKFEAYNYLDTADLAHAAYTVLSQLSCVSEWFWGFGYRPVKSPCDDANESTICTFYWSNAEQDGPVPDVYSGGAMLILADQPSGRSKRRQGRYGWPQPKHMLRPIVQPCVLPNETHDYGYEMRIQHFCNNRQKLMDMHWPQIKEKYSIAEDSDVDFGPVPKDGKPNEIVIRSRLDSIPEHEAVAYCLARTGRCRFKLGNSGDEVFVADRFPDHEPFDGTSAIKLVRRQ